MAVPESNAALAARVWRAMFGVLMQSAPDRTRSLSRRGLTPNDSRALASLDVREGKPMRALAEAWQCDPSYTTWIVDRLERLGLAVRRPAPRDRRVKLVILTRKGERTRRQLMEEFHQPPAEIASLARRDLEALDRILAKSAPDRI
jgi:DNA-binding MarR family transcriptional regulator